MPQVLPQQAVPSRAVLLSRVVFLDNFGFNKYSPRNFRRRSRDGIAAFKTIIGHGEQPYLAEHELRQPQDPESKNIGSHQQNCAV